MTPWIRTAQVGAASDDKKMICNLYCNAVVCPRPKDKIGIASIVFMLHLRNTRKL